MSVQLVGQLAFPVFCLYWYFVMLESLGSVQESDTCALPAVAERSAGLAGAESSSVTVTVTSLMFTDP